MYYVYMLQSEVDSDRFYVGLTADLRRRLRAHNSGESAHTRKYMPWRLATYVALSEKEKAERFEHYLKSGSGRSFAKKHF